MLSGNFQSQCEDSTFYLICADFSICYEIHDSCVKAFSHLQEMCTVDIYDNQTVKMQVQPI